MRWLIVVALLSLWSVWPYATWAHVVVTPDRSTAGGWERYSVLVPTEKSSPTVRVELRLPTGMEVVAVEAKPGWEGRYEPFPIGAARVEWKGGRIPENEFVAFDFLAWNPPAPRAIEWQATQWYEDGSSDHWGGGGDAEHHGSTTTLEAGSAHGGMHRHDEPGAAKPTTAKPPTTKPPK
jgi:uncharacterized protein YcnI